MKTQRVNNKKNKKNKKKQKNMIGPKPYTESERNAKMTAITFQMLQMNISHLVTDDLKKHMTEFIKHGTAYQEKIDLPEYSRIMNVNFINDKGQETFIKLAFKKIRVEGEGDENPINKLNKLQEELM